MRQGTVPLLLLLTVLAVAACSDGSGTASGDPSATPSVSATVAPSMTPSIAPTSAPPSAAPTSAQPSPSAATRPRLTGDGINLPTGVLEFGTPVETAVKALRTSLGPPTKDTGVGSSFSDYGTCPGTKLRALEYGGGALVVLFGDVKGKALTMYQWALSAEGTPARVPKASALIGDVTTYDFGVGTTVGALRAGVGKTRLTVTPPDEPVAALFEVKDQSSGIGGQLSGTTDRDTTTFVVAGQGGGE